MSLAAATRLGPYEVLGLIGAGGMGEVYKARDTRLDRTVAIKVLPADISGDPDRRARFEREAKAIAGLNHPHICALHDVGEHDGSMFLVMEHLEGETLAHHLAQGPLPIEKALTIATEIADALSTAHRQGIIHRDLKPANVILTKSGAKLLDFGLAKMRSAGPAVLSTDAITRTADPTALTGPGSVIGTIAYMSPEQVRGAALDARSDLFSFGSVLYEMATGARPFAGKTTPLIFDAILHEIPVAPSIRNADVPEHLQEIIGKALEKDLDLRYQDAGEIGRDLQRLRRDSGAQPARHRATISVPRRVAGFLLLLGIAATAVAAVVYRISDARRDHLPDTVTRQITSSPGLETDPAISPDGNTIAFAAREDGGNEDIWMVDAHGGPPQRLTTNPSRDGYPAWFPDGRTLAFVSDRDGRAGIWRAPRLDGDAATLLIPDADDPAISPDGHEIAFVRPSGAHRRVAVAHVDDPGHVRFLSTDREGKWDHSRPAWSPDGQTICYDAWDGLWLVPAHGGPARRLTMADARNDSGPTWSPDGRFIYFTSVRDHQAALWRVRLDGGASERVTVGSGTGRAPRVSRDGRLIAFATSAGTRDIVMRDLATGAETQFGSSREEMFPVFAPDGRSLYFISNRWGSLDIWSQDLADGKPVGAARRIAEAEGVESHLACSPDGKWIAYYRILRGRRDIFVRPSSGGAAVRITDDAAGSFDPAWSPDGNVLAFSSERDGTRQIWTVHVRDGHAAGSPVRITSGAGLHSSPVWSPDGSRIAYLAGEPGRADAAVIAADGQGAARLVTSEANIEFLRWSTTSGALLAAGTWGAPQFEIRTVNIDGTLPYRALGRVRLGTEVVNALFDISGDGRFLAFPRGILEGDIWLLEASSRSF